MGAYGHGALVVSMIMEEFVPIYGKRDDVQEETLNPETIYKTGTRKERRTKYRSNH